MSTSQLYYVLDNGKSTKVYHGADCRCLREHGPYRRATAIEVRHLRACGYKSCGGR